MFLKFPDNFYWGAATSSHQIEGNNDNDWSEWEKINAGRLAQIAKRKNWPDFILKNYPNPLQEENYISDRTCDYYNKFKEDFDIAKSLNHNSHRLAIEWSRIEPEEGKFNEEEIEHYRQVVAALRERNIEPFITLWHWPIPIWLKNKGGFESDKIVNYFGRYAERMVSELKNDVKFWLTFNEPEIYAANSYLRGIWPPQKKNIISYFRVIKNLIKAHKEIYQRIKNIHPDSQIGFAANIVYFEAHQNKIANRLLKKLADKFRNFYFLDRLNDFQDFIGLNHYFHNRIDYGFGKNENKILSDMGWEIYPEGIYYALKDLKRYNKPIYITENGLADAKDEKREKFIKEHLWRIHKAMQEGTDIRGYFHWSLLDNFEWDKGFWPRFGLIEIDYKTMERKIRKSAFEYAKICKNNGLEI